MVYVLLDKEFTVERIFHIVLALSLIIESTILFAKDNNSVGKNTFDPSLMEMPAVKSGDKILAYSGFTVNYNSKRLIPNWVAYELTAKELEGTVPRANSFSMDLTYKGKQAMREDYSNSGWDKGHMAPAADMKWSQTAMYESFYLTNVCPQNHELNGRDWQTLEKLCRTWAQKYGKVWIVCGPIIYSNRYGSIGNQNVIVPNSFFKAVLTHDGKSYKSIAFVMENISDSQPIRNSIVTVNELELLAGYDFFTNLNDNIEESVEDQYNLKDWNL